jgi:hypothetical protein
MTPMNANCRAIASPDKRDEVVMLYKIIKNGAMANHWLSSDHKAILLAFV